ncbi:hypothetical protein [Thermoproteus tenax]|uniref:Uncharacterized protein n=1 Tax=Thermoproteus tenax (strain ATCC 35583 / DSM 2078 / JCM 9277 / NBRC 100435 / Kra 1) TaxID=768679 RepID=G4RPP9_THETK|nr:hypothetical protein [Thermoproteus tenax]CCC81544.1 conserved hypothetical protein [Thermoproteus tenax Kra 1]
MRGLEALEVAILLSISLAIIFAAVPYIIQNIFQLEAGLEAKNVIAFLTSLADSLESDFGMTGVQRMYQLPSAYFGTFYVRTPRLYVSISCASLSGTTSTTFVFREAVVGYNSSYAEFGNAMLRGLTGSLLAPIGEPVIAVNSTFPSAVRLYTRVVYVNGTSSLYLYTISASFIQQGTGGALAYVVGPLNSTSLTCGGTAAVTVSSRLGSATATFNNVQTVYLVWNNVTLVWK